MRNFIGAVSLAIFVSAVSYSDASIAQDTVVVAGHVYTCDTICVVHFDYPTASWQVWDCCGGQIHIRWLTP